MAHNNPSKSTGRHYQNRVEGVETRNLFSQEPTVDPSKPPVFALNPEQDKPMTSISDVLAAAGDQATYLAEPQLTRAMNEGIVPWVAGTLDRGFSAIGAPVARTLFGPGNEGEEEAPMTEGTAMGVGGANAGSGANARTYRQVGRSSGQEPNARNTSQFTINIPTPADEILPEQKNAALDRATIDKFIGQLEETGPEEFERRDPRLNQLLAGAGQALAQAGQNPTLSEAILATGTGLAKARAAHEQQQDKLQRQRENAIAQAERQNALKAFEAEQALAEAEQNQKQLDMQRGRIELQQSNRRSEAMRNAGQPRDIGNGRSFVPSNTRLDENGNMVVEGKVINEEQERSFLDKMVLGGPEALENFELEIGDTNVADLAKFRQPAEKAAIIYGGQMAVEPGAFPANTFEGKGMPGLVQDINQQSKEQAAKLAQENPDANKEDLEDALRFRMIREQAARNPVFWASLMKASGSGVYRREADRIIQQHNAQIEQEQQK